MALVNITSVTATVKRELKKIAAPGGIELLSYKRNRTIAIIKKDNATVEIRERGYEEQDFEISADKLNKELKTLIKREFPRSRKLRLFKFSDPEELARLHQKI